MNDIMSKEQWAKAQAITEAKARCEMNEVRPDERANLRNAVDGLRNQLGGLLDVCGRGWDIPDAPPRADADNEILNGIGDAIEGIVACAYNLGLLAAYIKRVRSDIGV